MAEVDGLCSDLVRCYLYQPAYRSHQHLPTEPRSSIVLDLECQNTRMEPHSDQRSSVGDLHRGAVRRLTVWLGFAIIRTW